MRVIGPALTVIVIAVFVMLFINAASGQEAVTPVIVDNGADDRVLIGPMLSYLIGLFMAVASAALLIGMMRLGGFLTPRIGEENAEFLVGQLHAALDRGLAWARTRMEAYSADLSVEVQNRVAHTAAVYVTAQFPEALEKKGMTEDDVKRWAEARFAEMILREQEQAKYVLGTKVL